VRIGDDGFGASLLGNYGQGAPPGKAIVATAENVQGRLRYDRYVLDDASVFLLATGRHDRFQGLDFRLNADPGFKYLFVNRPANKLWVEIGYDFQYDIRRDADRIVTNDDGTPVLDASGQVVVLDKTFVDHSARLFAGARHAFNKEVTLTAGVEYLQSVLDVARDRLNFDAVFAAKAGETKGPIALEARGAVVFRVETVTPFDAAAFDKEKEGLREQLRGQKASKMLQALVQRRRSDLKVEFNKDLLSRMGGSRT